MELIIVDFKMGNLGSIVNMIKKIGTHALISSDPKIIANATKIILPGVGSFDHAMNNLDSLGLLNILNRKVINDGIPILGICLGMQLFSNKSEEGYKQGLGWIDAEVKRFHFNDNESQLLKIPHMGWNTLHNIKNNGLFFNMPIEPRFYFVHSYYFSCNDPLNEISITKHGNWFASAVKLRNIMGVQFHPEKSHKFGMQLLKNFVENF